MAHIPQSVLDRQPTIPELKLLYRGKVRDSYELPALDCSPTKKMLVVASDRLSIFDFVLPALVALKGAILTALNHFWTVNVINDICKTDLVACGSLVAPIDPYLPASLRGNIELQKRATVVDILPSPEVEDVVRLYLTGSGWESYKKDQPVCGHKLPDGLIDGSKLPYPIYTPTTKAQEGHDEHMDVDDVVTRYGFGRERLSLQVAQAIAAYAEGRGIILADTKFELSRDSTGKLFLADEKGTPDSSRFWDANAWRKARVICKKPEAFDKQFVRNWGIEAGVKGREPQSEADLAFVDSLAVPDTVLQTTTRIYRNVFWRLTGMTIEEYQIVKLGIAMSLPKRKIQVVIGSESDLHHAEEGLNWLRLKATGAVSICSCHRNPEQLRSLTIDRLAKADVVIAGAGKSAQLPAAIKAHLCALGKPEIPVIGVAFPGKTEQSNEAARLAIEELPDQPVELDHDGKAYFGSPGFFRACRAAVEHEFLPKAFGAIEARINCVTFF